MENLFETVPWGWDRTRDMSWTRTDSHQFIPPAPALGSVSVLVLAESCGCSCLQAKNEQTLRPFKSLRENDERFSTGGFSGQGRVLQNKVQSLVPFSFVAISARLFQERFYIRSKKLCVPVAADRTLSNGTPPPPSRDIPPRHQAS